ncbi:MAG: hypothetical protein R3C12_12455 [Planctomycetaceae bacterium]
MTVTYAKQHEYLVGVDSDGCAFDSMEIAGPRSASFRTLSSISDCSRFPDLPGKPPSSRICIPSRVANRFIAYLLAIDLLKERPDVQARGVKLPELQGLRDWMKRESKLGTRKRSGRKRKRPAIPICNCVMNGRRPSMRRWPTW